MPLLTDKSVKQFKASPARRELPDTICPGLRLVVQPSGAKSWAVRYYFQGRYRKHTLGAHPKVGLADARQLARTALEAVAKGTDPGTEKHRVKPTDHTFDSAWADYIARHVDVSLRKSTATEYKRLFANVLRPRWRKRSLAEIATADISALKHGLRATPAAADKALAIVGAFFNWCTDTEQKYLTDSPCKGVRKVKRSKAEKTKQTRKLSDDEIRWLWTACESVGFPFGPLCKMLLLTGARRNEVAELPEGEINRMACMWLLPAERAKNGHQHGVYLSDASLAVLDSLPNLRGDSLLRNLGRSALREAGSVPIKNESVYLFSYNGKTPCSGFSRGKRNLDKKMLELARAEASARGDDPAKVMIPPWHLHDLRRTFTAGLAKLKIPMPIAEKCLNHISESFADVASIYQVHDYETEMKAAFMAWGSYVESLVAGVAAGNRVPIRA
jgi:integrase